MSTEPPSIEPRQTGYLVILGAGVMGTGIGTVALGHGFDVLLVDPDPDQLARAEAGIDRGLRLAQLMGRLPDGMDWGALRTSGSPDALDHPRAVIEAVTENYAVKAELLAKVSAALPAGTPLISNTSSIPVNELAGTVLRPEDLLGTHFMNPPTLIRTVEVIRGPRTGEAVVAATGRLLTELGRRAVVVNDAPGFVTSRVLHPMINTAARVVQAGTAAPEEVDALMEGCLGHPTGPLRTADLIGIDNLVDSLQVLWERTGDESCKPCDLLLAKVRAGELGRKSGTGFYTYETPQTPQTFEEKQ
ncbi:3-hydroxyacyl-CoA dehydrogenase family protein [Streptomyces sp. NPDC048362]|uniref:3-hydroxyacyl-CoA dehydrogenase family protein n=1 Tax=Streptomyces sp. NPDC048362 TaxID=3365539 RepID=UPI00371D13BC